MRTATEQQGHIHRSYLPRHNQADALATQWEEAVVMSLAIISQKQNV